MLEFLVFVRPSRACGGMRWMSTFRPSNHHLNVLVLHVITYTYMFGPDFAKRYLLVSLLGTASGGADGPTAAGLGGREQRG